MVLVSKIGLAICRVNISIAMSESVRPIIQHLEQLGAQDLKRTFARFRAIIYRANFDN